MGMKIFSFILGLNDLGQLHNGFIRGLRNDNLFFFLTYSCKIELVYCANRS